MPRKIVRKAPDNALSQASALLTQYIREQSMRDTPERHIVLEAVWNRRGRFTVDDIAADIGQTALSVSRTTVANALALLCRCGLVIKAGMSGRNVSYQKAPRVGAPRQRHSRLPFAIALQCTGCGLTKEVRDKEATAALASRRFGSFFPVSGIITIFGLCARCAEKKHQ